MAAADATGEAETGPLRLHFDRSVKLAFRGSSISSDGGLLLHRELDDALGLTDAAAGLIGDPRTGRNGRHRLAGLLRQSIFSRLAGCEDVNRHSSFGFPALIVPRPKAPIKKKSARAARPSAGNRPARRGLSVPTRRRAPFWDAQVTPLPSPATGSSGSMTSTL